MIIISKTSLLTALTLLSFTTVGCSTQSEANSPQTATDANLASSPAGLQLAALTVTAAGNSVKKTHNFTVEMAQSDEEQARGLMFRTQLAPDAGMIFPFPEDKIASFWMKNTVIPLDIIFVKRDGTIESIATNTTPYSLDAVISGAPVASVLEIAAGRAAELSIAAGDKVQWK
jgi:uncharacterized membrane protein (UPF0127 family)